MKSLKKLTLVMITFVIINILIFNIRNNFYISSIATIATPPNVGVLLFNINDPYMSLVKQSLENIEKDNPNTVRFSFYDAIDNQAIQNATINNLVNSNIDLLLVNSVNTQQATILNLISAFSAKNIPLILFNIELPINITSSTNKVFAIATDSKNSGVMQGKILVDLWNSNKEIVDKNGDNVLQYIMLQGKSNNEAAINRTIYSISELNSSGIKTQELAVNVCNWERDCAKNAINSLFLKYDGGIEAIIANNDAMAVGAIEALQAHGYNNGDKTKTIPVVGVDAIPEARELISKGFMAGTVYQDPKDLANALYSIGLNLLYNRDPLEGTTYTLTKKGSIETPYYKYIQ